MLITMAGKGSRFRDSGIKIPKHEIEVSDKPMFDWAMRSLESFYDKEFIFITHSDHSATEFLLESCDRLGISKFQQIALDEYTSGQAQTALKADELLRSQEAVAIYNIDTYIEEGKLVPEEISGEGFIPTFISPGKRWSFVRTNDEGHVVEVSEKKKISDIATAGFYYFDRWEHFVNAYEHSAQKVKSEYGETYVAPLYNHLIDQGLTVLPHRLDQDSIHVLGTPEDLAKFYSDFSPQ